MTLDDFKNTLSGIGLKYYQDEEYQENLFYDNKKARDIHRIKGSYIPAENLIELFKNHSHDLLNEHIHHLIWHL